MNTPETYPGIYEGYNTTNSSVTFPSNFKLLNNTFVICG